MQQMEEHAKTPQDQTNEEDYRKSTWKRIQGNDSKDDQNLENKVEAQKIAWRHGSRRCKKWLTWTSKN